MKTPTHLAINYLLLSRLGVPSAGKKAFLLGGILPDIPVILVFVGCFLPGRWDSEALTLFRSLYESNAWVLGSHNLLHSPLSLLLLALVTPFLGSFGRSLEAFLAGCFVHSLVDIYTHVGDGPLVFWPLEANTRFDSLISHWDANYWGELVLGLEAIITAVALSLVYSRKHGAKVGLSALFHRTGSSLTRSSTPTPRTFRDGSGSRAGRARTRRFGRDG